MIGLSSRNLTSNKSLKSQSSKRLASRRNPTFEHLFEIKALLKRFIPQPHMLVPKTTTPTCRTSHKLTQTEVSSGSSSLPENPVQFWMQRQQKRREEEAQQQNHKTEWPGLPLPGSPLPELPLRSSLLSLSDRTRTLHTPLLRA